MKAARQRELSAPPIWLGTRQLLPGHLALLTIGLLVGYALRLYRLGVKDIWWDEAHSWWYAAMPLAQGVREGMAAWHGAAGDPLFTVVLHFWIGLVSDGAFAMRYLSLLANLLTVAWLGRLAARAFGWRAGVVSALIGVIAPIWIFYSQEVRQYSLTPLFMLIVVEAVIDLSRAAGTSDPISPPPSTWLKLVLGEALSLYTHSFMVFGMVGINLMLGWLWFRAFLAHRSMSLRWLRDWVFSQVAVLALIAPTIPNYLLRAGAGRNPFTERLSLFHILNAQWAFFVGIPWERATDTTPLRFLSIAVLLLTLPGLLLGLRRYRNRQLADLLWIVLGITAITLAYWMFNPVIHPRYLIYLTGPVFVILAVVLLWTWRQPIWGPPVSILLGLTLTLTSAFSLDNLYTGRYFGYRHDPTASVARILQEQFDSDDGVISIDANDFSLSYYGVGQAELFRAGLNEGISTPAELVAFLVGKDRIGVVSFHAQRSDTRGIIPFYLERFGSLIDKQSLESYTIYTYRLDPNAQPTPVALEPTDLSWGMLSVKGVSVESGDAVTVALQWQAASDFVPGSHYAAIVSLIDPQTDWKLAEASNLLYAEDGQPTGQWQPGQQADQYFVLPLWPGTPPIDAELRVKLVDAQTGQALDLRDAAGSPAGQWGRLGTVALGPAPERWVYDGQPPFRWLPVLSDVLSAYALDWPTTVPGGTVGLTLSWLLPPEQVQVAQVSLRLIQNGRLLAEDSAPPLQGRQPATASSWLDRRVLQVSREAAPGLADLVMHIGETQVALGSVEVLGFERITERPTVPIPLEATFGSAIRLLGFDLEVPNPLTSRSTLLLTLYWQALTDGTPDADYAVFAQILDSNGRLVGQHDGVPVFGTRPVSGWLQGEYLIDEHPMVFREAYSGPIQIQVGLYNPASLERLPTSDGRDSVVLPLKLEVVSDE